MFNSYGELASILDSLEFTVFYKKHISKRDYVINYGQKKGIIHSDSIRMAAENYTYTLNNDYMINIDNELSILNCTKNTLNENELILQCIEIFDWGGVQKSNTMKAINLYREGKLSEYLLKCKVWFEDDTVLDIHDSDIIWSSGWTKVYSFMSAKTTIYDSRVAAFINWVMIELYNELGNDIQREKLKSITSKLVSFQGTADRTRCVCKADRNRLGIKMKSGKTHNNFIANKIASWILRYIAEAEFLSSTQNTFRQIDKAAFMLGFDISQLNSSVSFE